MEKIGTGGQYHSKMDMNRTSQPYTAPYGLIGDGGEDGDSGVFNSSKATTGSYVSDMDLAEEDEGRGVWNYIPDSTSPANSSLPLKKRFTRAKASTKEEIEQQHDIAYDGAFDADSDCEQRHSVGTNTGGRIIKSTNKYDSELLEGTEMKTFSLQEKPQVEDDYLDHLRDDYNYENLVCRQQNTEMYDEAHSCDSDDSGALQSVVIHRAGSSSGDESLSKVNVHKRLYNADGDFTKMEDDFSDTEELPVYEQRKYVSSPMRLSGMASNTNRKTGSEQDSVLRIGSNYSTVRSSGGNHDVHPSKNCFPSSTSFNLQTRSDFSVKPQPVFGSPPDFKKLGYSAEKLLDSRGPSSKSVYNMPKGAPIMPNHTVFSDSHESAYSPTPDGSERKKKSRRKKSHNDPGGGSEAKDENGNPLEPSHQPYNAACSTMGSEAKELETAGANKEAGRKRGKGKKDRQDVVKAENIPGHFDSNNIDELLSFINNDKCKGNGSSKSRGGGCHQPPVALVTPASTNHRLEKTEKVVSSRTTEQRQVENVESLQPAGKKKKKKTTSISSTTPAPTSTAATAAGSSKSDPVEDKEPLRNGVEPGACTTIVEKVVSAVSSEVTNHAVRQASPPILDNRTINTLPDMTDYITDYVEAPVKPEPFAVVQRKKRSKRDPEVFVETNSYRNYDNSNKRPRGSNFHNYRGGTPPNDLHTAMSWSDKTQPSNNRALSPSSFPALHRGRRNSTDSVPQPEMIHDDSSDLESVQSMASGHGSNGSQAGAVPSSSSASSITQESSNSSLITSALPAPISYASIAAGGSKGSGSANPGESGEEVYPRERRHSFGSIPLGKDSEAAVGATMAASRSSEVSRSQEFPAIATAVPISHVTGNDTSSQSSLPQQPSDAASLPQSDSPLPSRAQASPCQPPDSTLQHPLTVTSASSHTSTPSQSDSGNDLERSLTPPSIVMDKTGTMITAVPVFSQASAASQGEKQPCSCEVSAAAGPSPPKTHAPTRRTKPTPTPVIFLDTRRIKDVSFTRNNNHGLSFGFELDLAVSADNSSPDIDIAAGQVNTSISADDVVCKELTTSPERTTPSVSGCRQVSETVGVENSPRGGGDGGSPLTFLQAPLPSSDAPAPHTDAAAIVSRDTSQVSKLLSHPPSNGLLRPSQMIMATPVQPEQDGNTQPSPSPAKVSTRPTTHSANKFLAAIVSTGNQNQSATKDPNFDPGFFDLVGAQVWLYSSFEKVLAEKTKYPDRVHIYKP